MKQVVLNIPDNKYLAFINHIKTKFSYIMIDEETLKDKDIIEEGSTYEVMLLAELNLAEDWLSDEDNTWDDVL